MHISRKPGEKIEVDWAGQTASIVDNITGEIIKAYIFVGVLPYSQYAYVEAFLSQNLESWIAAHINMFQFFGGAARMLVPDNLKTGHLEDSHRTIELSHIRGQNALFSSLRVHKAQSRRPDY